MFVRRRWRCAWITLTAAFGLHVLDEAQHDFLPWYNTTALALRDRLGGLPFPPVFTYSVWLVGLITAVLLLAALTPLIRPGRRWPIVAAYVYGVVHLANALGHLTISAAGRWIAPGALSSPILLLASLWLLYETRRAQQGQADEGRPS